MVELETVEELADAIADMVGVYGCGPEHGDHEDDCNCRMCLVIDMTDRIRQAVENEEILSKKAA